MADRPFDPWDHVRDFLDAADGLWMGDPEEAAAACPSADEAEDAVAKVNAIADQLPQWLEQFREALEARYPD